MVSLLVLFSARDFLLGVKGDFRLFCCVGRIPTTINCSRFTRRCSNPFWPWLTSPIQRSVLCNYVGVRVFVVWLLCCLLCSRGRPNLVCLQFRSVQGIQKLALTMIDTYEKIRSKFSVCCLVHNSDLVCCSLVLNHVFSLLSFSMSTQLLLCVRLTTTATTCSTRATSHSGRLDCSATTSLRPTCSRCVSDAP